jgi:predicted nuclease of predicted toxin-antitoxin system
MLFLADECCDALVVRTLRELGYDVTYVAELAPGLADIDVLAQSVSEERILLTEDRDFGELVFKGQETAYGVVLLRIPPEERQQKRERITALVQGQQSELPGAMVIVTLNTIRIRPLPVSSERDDDPE